MRRLEGRVSLVTGAGSGIGRSTACRFAEEGAIVVVVDINADGAAETAELIEGKGQTACWFQADVSQEEAVTDVVEEVQTRFGTPSVLMTAAAISVGATVPDTGPEEWDRVFEVNVKGTFLWMRACIPLMAAKGGSIIAVASQLAVSGGLSNAASIASKAGTISPDPKTVIFILPPDASLIIFAKISAPVPRPGKFFGHVVTIVHL